MKVDLPVTEASQYFERDIDWDNDTSYFVPLKQAQALQKILTTEVAIYLLRRSTGFCGSLVDDMVAIRKKYIEKYETHYAKYHQKNDFY